MAKQTVTWTALPNGADRARGIARLSVFVSPRLEAGSLLGDFKEWVVWPDAAPREFVVYCKTAGGTPASFKAKVVSAPPDPKLWSALFDEKTYVRSYQYRRLDDKRIRSYRADYLMSFLKGRYQDAAVNHGSQFPPAQTLLETWRPLGTSTKERERWMESIRNEKVPSPTEPFNAGKDFARASLFHKALSQRRVKVEVPQLDFHEMLGSLSQHPDLCRQLGIIFDLEFESQGMPIDGLVQVRPDWAPPAPGANVLPWTHYQLGSGGGTFRARSQQGTYVQGKLPLNNTKVYSVLQVDVGGGSLKALNFAAALPRLVNDRFAPTAGAAALPSLRSTGLQVARLHRAAHVMDLLIASTARNGQVGSGGDVELYAEDIMRGFRLDVWEKRSARWYSLHQRWNEYTFTRAGSTAYSKDEGWAATAAGQSADPAAPDDLHLHEVLADWSGWSLSAPMPGKTIGVAEDVADGSGEVADTGLPFTARSRVQPGTLPRLRFGRTYRLQARSVDLAGNGPAFDEKDNLELATPETVYARFDPVDQPTLIPRADFKPAESLEHIVARTWVTPPPGVPTTETGERHVAPPVTTQNMAERHGMFDGPGGLRADAYAQIIALEGFAPDRAPEDQWKLNYLPDPKARGAALDFQPGGLHQISFEGATPWPEWLPFRLVLEGGPAEAVNWIPAKRVLVVTLPPSYQKRVRFSSYLHPEDLEEMGIWQWIKESVPEGDPRRKSLEKLILEGRHWMITPWRELTLVHAVQQPLSDPSWQGAAAQRQLGDTSATIQYRMQVHSRSTGKLDFHAAWEEPVDLLTQPGPEVIAGRANPFDAMAQYGTDLMGGAAKHEFGDTKHRLVRYSATAITRYPEYYPEGTAPMTRQTAQDLAVHVPSSARPAAPSILYVVPAYAWEESSSPLTRTVTRRRKGNILRVYLNRPWYSSGADEQLGVVLNLRSANLNPLLPDPAAPLKPFYETQWAEDPIRSGTSPGPLTEQNLPLKTGAGVHVSLAENENHRVTVVPHEVHYSAERQCWYCDIELRPNAAVSTYAPMVRLALVRYQPYAIANAEISPVALADFSQLSADRTLSVAPKLGNPNTLTVALSGAYEAVGSAGGGRRVEVVLERAGTGDLGWTPVSQPVQLKPAPLNAAALSGEVSLPSASGTYRLVVKEYERLLVDRADRRVEPGADQPEELWRLVYVDAVELKR